MGGGGDSEKVIIKIKKKTKTQECISAPYPPVCKPVSEQFMRQPELVYS